MSEIRAADLIRRYTDTRKFYLGQIVEDDGAEFEFVKFNSGAGDVDAVAGQIGYYVSAGTTGAVNNEVTMDYSSNAAGTAITMPNMPAGFFQAALEDEEYGFVQKNGWSRIAMLTDGNVDANERLTVSSTDGEVIPIVDATPPLETVAIARNADTGTSLAAGDAKITIP